MDYRFLDPGDERLIELSQLSSQGGIALAVRTTGYDPENDEIVELAITDLAGTELFHKVVKPQNIEGWPNGEACGGLLPADVQDAPELFQFEEELSQIVEGASLVVAQHLPFVKAMMDSSWVTLPDFAGFDLIDEFCATHSISGYANQPATVAALADIAHYYGLEYDDGSALAMARSVAACQNALVAECERERQAKGDEYWARREERLAEEAAQSASASETARLREKRLTQMNGLLWVAGGLIFISVIIQLLQRGGDIGFMVVCAAAAVFCFVRAFANLRPR